MKTCFLVQITELFILCFLLLCNLHSFSVTVFNFNQMEAKVISKLFNHRLSLQHFGMVFPIRYYSSDLTPKHIRSSNIKKSDEKEKLQQLKPWSDEPSLVSDIPLKFWYESYAVRRQKKLSKDINNMNSIVDLLRILQSLKSFPRNLSELLFYFKKRHQKNEIAAQKYLPERVSVLKYDLAAAHFLINRNGSVKFLGKPDWVGAKGKNYNLPLVYVPGMYIECIDAEGTDLYYEGLPNLSNLIYLSYLSLKNLETVNDWFLDWISSEYYSTLKHLDISGCKNVTYRGLSCFYRFECLETLNVEGVSDSPEFKLACLLLLQEMPFLDIKGIDLNIPEKINPVKVEGPISDSQKF